jgi:tetratricopeptide (TPR) repeat protein
MRLIEGVLTFIRLGGNHLSFRDYIVAIGDYIHTELNSDLIGCLGNGYIKSGDTSKAQEFLVTAINHSRATGNLHLLCEQLANLGRLHYQLQDLFQSEHCYTEALSICQSAQDREMELECQRSLAIVYLGLGNNQSNNANEINAIDYYKKALAYSRAIGDQVHEIILLSNLGIVYRRLGILRKAFTVWIATLLLDLDIDKIGSSDTGNVRSIIEKVTYNLSIATKSEPVFSTIIGEIATNWKRAITEATSQEYAELGSVDVETLNRVITNLLESA